MQGGPAKRAGWAPGATTLAAAARAVALVVGKGRTAEVALQTEGAGAERSAVRAITLGTLRWYLRLVPAIDSLLTRPRTVSPLLRALLAVAAHQVEYSRNVPQHTVHAAVDAVRVLGQPRAAGMVNAVLRRFVAERASIFERLDTDVVVRTAHPGWLVEALAEAWPERYEAILAANNAHPPLVLRIDATRTTVEEYLEELRRAGLAGRPLGFAPQAIELDRPVAVDAIPGFAEGRVSVQDAGAQLAAYLLDAARGMRVLDACAAPGGKTSHLLERTPDLAELVAVDVDESRMARVRENLERLRRTARLCVADVRRPESFWDGRPFDRILVDAPCSSTGVIRRHPDIKLLRRAGDLEGLAAVQGEILAAAFRMLAPGGRLLYSTCSVLPVENDEVVRRFLAREPTARSVPLPPADRVAPGAADRPFGIQLLPGAAAGTDGFYYACLEKTTAGT